MLTLGDTLGAGRLGRLRETRSSAVYGVGARRPLSWGMVCFRGCGSIELPDLFDSLRRSLFELVEIS